MSWENEGGFDDAWGDDAESRADFADDGWGADGALGDAVSFGEGLLRGTGDDAFDGDGFPDDLDGPPETITRGLGGDFADPNDEWMDQSDPSGWAAEADPTDSDGDFLASLPGDGEDRRADDEDDDNDDRTGPGSK